jgi:hypothetical protein
LYRKKVFSTRACRWLCLLKTDLRHRGEDADGEVGNRRVEHDAEGQEGLDTDVGLVTRRRMCDKVSVVQMASVVKNAYAARRS